MKPRARTFYALVHEEDGTEFGVSFPDLPGCVSAGDMLDLAARQAQDALALHLKGLVEDGGLIPAPSPLERIAIHAAEDAGSLVAIIPVSAEAGVLAAAQ